MIQILKIDYRLYIAIDKNIYIHCRFRSRFIVNQNFIFTFPFPISLPFPGYCGLALTLPGTYNPNACGYEPEHWTRSKGGPP